MSLTQHDVTEAYRLLLGRLPESEKVVQYYLQNVSDARGLVTTILGSQEAKENLGIRGEHEHHIYKGYTSADEAVIREFSKHEGEGVPNFVTSFLGCRYRTAFSTPLAQLGGRVEGYPLPVGSFQGETAEFVGTLRSVLEAKGNRYRMLECGAGYGTWMAISRAAAKQKGIADIHVYGIEGDAGHYDFLQQHMADNDIPQEDFTSLKGAVGSAAGTAEWPVVEDPSDVYGSRPLGDRGINYHGGRPTRTVSVEVFALPAVLAREPVWDLIHMDIQGGEGDLCRNCIEAISECVRRVVVGTHSRALDGDVMSTFHAAGWSLENEKPTISHWQDGAATLEAMAAVDGVQVWRNARELI